MVSSLTGNRPGEVLGEPGTSGPDRERLDALRIDRDRAPRRRVPGWAVLAVLLIGLVVAAAAWWAGLPQPVEVHTMVIHQPVAAANRTLLNASGYVTARRQATVSSKVTGLIVDVLMEEGMRVEAGQVLARIDASNVQRSLELAQAQLELARRTLGETLPNLVQAQREWRRISQLAAQKAASQLELDQAETEMKSLEARLQRQKAEVAVAEQEVDVWKQQMQDTVIQAPFAGVVTSKDAQPGEVISPMSAGGSFTRTGICTIVDMSSLEIEVDVNESYINRVTPNMPVVATLDAYPNWKIPAHVIAIIPTADRQKATVKVRVGFEEPDPRILPEMSVKVEFQNADAAQESDRPMVIPKEAVHQQDGRDIVWVVVDGHVQRRAVTLGRADGDGVEVAAGLNGGERIVIEQAEGLAEGVEVVEAR